MGSLLTLFASNKPASLVLPAGALAVYSVAKTPSWNGACMRIKRSSDNTQTDIGFTSTGWFDMAAAVAFAGGSTITVEKWYDQSGNGYDAIGAGTDRPTLIAGNTINGKQPISFYKNTGTGGTWVGAAQLTLPAGVSVSNRAFTMATCYADGVGVVGSGVVDANSLTELGAVASPNRGLLFYRVDNSVLASDGFKFEASDKKLFTPRCGQVESLIYGSDASNLFLRNNGNTVTSAAFAAQTYTGGFIGVGSLVLKTAMEQFAYVVYGSTLSADDRALIDTAFNTTFGANIPMTSKIVYEGDSITAGTAQSAEMYGYPRVVSAINRQSMGVYNLALSGRLMATCYANRANSTARRDASVAKNFSSIFAGTNDLSNRASGTIVGYGTTVWTSYLLPFIQAMQAGSFDRVFVGTMVARSWAGSAQDIIDQEAERLVYNTLIRNNATTYGYTVLDYASLSEMSVSTNTTYFVDGVHPTKLGYSVMGTYAAPIIAGYI